MNAIKFLLTEHNKVRNMLQDIQQAVSYETKKNIFHKLGEDLIRHEHMEETVWYPFLKQDKALAEIIPHLVSEEKKAEKAIEKLAKISEEPEWEETFLKLKADVEHHAREEEDKLFPQVEDLLGEEELEEIGKDMLTFHKEFFKQL